MRDLLVEIGVEEIPPSHLQPAEDYIRGSFIKLMRDSALEYSGLQVSSTPRRFFLLANGVQETQADLHLTKIGPAKVIALDAEGNLLPAGTGFLKKNSAAPEDIYVEKTEKGEFIAVDLVQNGRATVDILKDWILDLLPRIPFPKTMVWNDSKLGFSRPLRWLCLLWGNEVIPVSVAGIASGNFSFGNRYLGLDSKLTVKAPADYFEVLRGQAVLPERSARKAKLAQELAGALKDTEYQVIPDERLIDTVTDLVEFPTAVVAEFSPEFLKLPEKIITSTISQNQKYFSVQDRSGRLSNKFVFISNGDPACSDIIRKGNEKVVTARLDDALWYFQEDTRVPLESYLPKLEEVVFQSKLGTIAAKSRRIQNLSGFICSALDFEPQQKELVLRTAKLCKADLVTTMLGEKEFTKLQGYIGQQYALASNEPTEVATGIYEHYKPRGTNDGLPRTLCGSVVAVADKLDSVCGIIGVGQIPTGSADPFALRRAANGVVQIIVECGWDLELAAVIAYALQEAKTDAELTKTAENDVRLFFQQRVEWLLRQMELDYDVIDSVMHFALGNLAELKRRTQALQSFKGREDFLRLVIGFKRVANIISEADSFTKIDETLLTEEAEKILYSRLQELRLAIDSRLKDKDFTQAITLLVEYGGHIDNFFDAVLVNCDDEALRKNRYALLNEIKGEFLRVADISKIVIENDTGTGT
ncbi:MAG TPA: glycine--tRNA ligase subunit beta [Candidatus Syntrophosphaera sp.]|jgi:glycyl-tRNA synthetase beta chain|nr:glycine--tRNA ligase subunit beta [Candidatus Syntrophosphaera sp.]